MRLIYADPILVYTSGHHMPMCERVMRQARARSIETRSYGHSGMAPYVRERLGAVPFFHASPNLAINSDPICGFMTGFFNVAKNFWEELSRLPDVRASDLIYMPVNTAAYVMGAAQWLEQFPAGEAPHLIVDLTGSPGIAPEIVAGKPRWLPPDPNADARPTLYRFAGLQMRPFNLPTLRFVTQGPGPSEGFAHLLLRDVHTMPSVPVEAPRVVFKRGERKRLTVLVGGVQGEHKGFGFVPEIFTELLKSHDNLRVVAHNSNPDTKALAQTCATLRAMAAADDRVIYDDRSLSNETYLALLEAADLVLCPYDPNYYRVATSAIATECLANGIPVIVPANTEVARPAQRCGAAITFESYDAASITAAAKMVIGDFESYATRAVMGAQKWAQEGGADKFFDELLRLASQRAAA